MGGGGGLAKASVEGEREEEGRGERAGQECNHWSRGNGSVTRLHTEGSKVRSIYIYTRNRRANLLSTLE